jgi:hypothetical protein
MNGITCPHCGLASEVIARPAARFGLRRVGCPILPWRTTTIERPVGQCISVGNCSTASDCPLRIFDQQSHWNREGRPMLHQRQRQVHIDPIHARRRRRLAESVGMLARDEYTAAGCAAGHAVGVHLHPPHLTEFAEKGYMLDHGETWDGKSVYCLLAALESRRRWKPTPSRHDVKKSGARLQIEQAQAAGVPILELEQYTVEDLLIWLTGSDSRAERECLYEIARLKLAGFE